MLYYILFKKKESKCLYKKVNYSKNVSSNYNNQQETKD